MHTNTDYSAQARPALTTADRERLAALDLVRWVGFRRSLIVFRFATNKRRSVRERWHNFNMACSFAGVSGFPVLAAFARLHGWSVAYLRDKAESESWSDDDQIQIVRGARQ